MFLIADLSAAASAAQEAFSGGLSSTPVVLTLLGVLYSLFKAYGPQIIAAVVAALQNVPQPSPTPVTPVKDGPILDILQNLIGSGLTTNMPILKWFLALPPEQQAAFFVAVKERLNAK